VGLADGPPTLLPIVIDAETAVPQLEDEFQRKRAE
jgi:hypothetical protein